jgi:polar amino acid transport system substrate-binding protein
VPPVPPAARAELTPTGKLRVGVNTQQFLLTRKDPVSGEISGITVDLAHELGRRLGVPVEIVPYPVGGDLAASATTGAWDMAFLAADPKRLDFIVFTAPFVEIETTYLVRAASPFRTVEDVDRDGVRISVGGKGGADLALSRVVTRAQIVRAQNTDVAAEMFVMNKVDALAGSKPALVAVADRTPGLRVVEGRYSVIGYAAGIHRGHDAGAKYLSAFAEDVKSSGLVARLIEKNEVRGLTVAPLAKAQ